MYLRYEVQSPSRKWTREFVTSRSAFTELRDSGDRLYTLGFVGARAWMRIESRAPVEIDGELAAHLRTEAGWIAMRFGRPEWGDRFEIETCSPRQCTFVFNPKDGHTLWVDVDRSTRRPVSFSWITAHGRIEVCDAISWSEVGGVPVISSTTCGAILDKVGLETETWTLVERRDGPAAPTWARVDPDEIIPLDASREVASFPVADPSRRAYVPVDVGGVRLNVVLDTGSRTTVLSRRALSAAGVVWSSDPGARWEGPWVPGVSYDTALVDRLVIGGLELRGISVLVAREGQRDMFHLDGETSESEEGLLGNDVLSRFVVDLDGPSSMLRFWPHGVFHDSGFAKLHNYLTSTGGVAIRGAIDEIGPLPVVVDTGAPLDLVVTGPAMHSKHPRHRGDEISLGEGVYDYESAVTGFHFGPFGLPRTPAIGRERRPGEEFLDDGGVLMGLGVMRHFRFAFDAEHAVVDVAPGPSYDVLNRLGIEIDDRGGVATITRVVDGEHEWRKPLREGDVVVSVNGRNVGNRTEALEAIVRAGGTVRLVVERAGNRVERRLALY